MNDTMPNNPESTRAERANKPSMLSGSAGTLLMFGLFAVLVLAGIRQFAGRKAPTPPVFNGEVTLATASQESAESGKPIFAVLTADWCPPCQAYKRDALADPEVANRITSEVIPVYIDYDDKNRFPDDTPFAGLTPVEALVSAGLPERFGLPVTMIIEDGQIVEIKQERLSVAGVNDILDRAKD